MKARVKATGEIVDVMYSHTAHDKGYDIIWYCTPRGACFSKEELEFIDTGESLDYWTRLEHQYAGMAMQGMVKRAYNAYCDDCANYENMIFEDAQALLKDHAEALADVCVEFAHALVEKLKEEGK